MFYVQVDSPGGLALTAFEDHDVSLGDPKSGAES